MKTSINTWEEALIMEMENLYCSEKKVSAGLNKLSEAIHSEKLHSILSRYAETAENKRLKIDRIFSYLNHEPNACHTSVIDEIINETLSRIKFAEDSKFQDLILITCLQRINAYANCAYGASLRYAIELELDTVADLLEVMIGWQLTFERELMQIADSEFKNGAMSTTG